MGKLGVLKVEPLEKSRVWKMAPINVIFYLAIFTNGKVLQYSTVETFIAFRSLTPLLVSFLDTAVRGEPAPSLRTVTCLAMIAFSASAYAYDDSNFSIPGYSWACIYLSIIVTEMVYAKHVTATMGLSTWGLVFYQNVIAVAIFPFASLLTGEFADIIRLLGVMTPLPSPESPDGSESTTGSIAQLSVFAAVPILISCVLGTGISFAGWGTRSAISATQFTVLGVACKLATVLVNMTVWSYHAPLLDQLAIVLCIAFSVAYQQSAKADKEDRLQAKPQLRESENANGSAVAFPKSSTTSDSLA